MDGDANQLEMIVEIPRGAHNKFEMDHATGAIWLDRTLFTATQYPADYGFIPQTLSEDGDPLDALVLLDEIEHFFHVYKDVEPGKDTEPGRWEGADSARRIVDEARARHPG
jgi:inorganic pyrophosphatase